MKQPASYNELHNVKFKFDAQIIPNVTFWVQSCILPSLQLENSLLHGATRDVPIPGHKIEFENLIINFIVDDLLVNYEEVYNWFQVISVARDIPSMVSNCSLHFLNGNNEVSRTIDFVGVYPMMLTELSMNSDDSDVLPTTCSVMFNYQYFRFSDSPAPVWA